MSLDLQFLRILFCENDKWHLGRLRHCCVPLNLRIDSCIDKCILFLEEMKIWISYFRSNHDIKQTFMYRTYFESVYKNVIFLGFVLKRMFRSR